MSTPSTASTPTEQKPAFSRVAARKQAQALAEQAQTPTTEPTQEEKVPVKKSGWDAAEPAPATTAQQNPQSSNKGFSFGIVKNLFGVRKTSGATPPEPSSTTKSMAKEESVIDSIPSIPTLEEEAEEAMNRQIAEAPEAFSHKVQSLKELDKALSYLSIADKINEGIDLGILSRVLSPLEDIVENDEPWEGFREVLNSLSAPAPEEKTVGTPRPTAATIAAEAVNF